MPSPPDDYAFGDQLCPVNAHPYHYVWDGLIAASDWLFRTSDADGARLDDMKGMNVGFMKSYMNSGAMKKKWFFGEYASGNRNDTNWWVDQVRGRASALDFDFHYNMVMPMCMDAGSGNFFMGHLAGRGMIGNNPMKAVPFVESMDSDTNGFATVIFNKTLGYAFCLAVRAYRWRMFGTICHGLTMQTFGECSVRHFRKNFRVHPQATATWATVIPCFTTLRAATRATQSPAGDKSTAMEGAGTNQHT